MIKNLLLITMFLFAGLGGAKAQSNIKYANFKISERQNRVSIEWTTDGSIATNYFAIQKSTDGINFKTIAMVLGADPAQKSCECFGCHDKISNKAYYRLIHVDTKGIEEVSETKLMAKN